MYVRLPYMDKQQSRNPVFTGASDTSPPHPTYLNTIMEEQSQGKRTCACEEDNTPMTPSRARFAEKNAPVANTLCGYSRRGQTHRATYLHGLQNG